MLFVGTRLCNYVDVFVLTSNYFYTGRWILMKCCMNLMLVKPTVHTRVVRTTFVHVSFFSLPIESVLSLVHH
jgi:hypothetical protein